MIKHFFFDLDNTLMLSRSMMTPEHQAIFKKLCDARDVVVVSGAQESQIRKQIPETTGARFFVLGQTGNEALDKNREVIWKEVFTQEQTDATLAFIETLKKEFDANVKDPDDLVELRGSQISYSPIGHNESKEKKYAFDAGAVRRNQVLTKHADEVKKINAIGIDVVPGGTTCFDFFLAGKNKGFNVARLIEKEGWLKDESVYVGDALFPGGNDETVLGVIPTHAVKNPDETFAFVSESLA